MSSFKIFLLENTFQVVLHFFQCIYIIKTVFNLKIKFKLKIDQKWRTFKNLEEIRKTWKNFEKASGTLFTIN